MKIAMILIDKGFNVGPFVAQTEVGAMTGIANRLIRPG
jgi:hypothetical protein